MFGRTGAESSAVFPANHLPLHLNPAALAATHYLQQKRQQQDQPAKAPEPEESERQKGHKELPHEIPHVSSSSASANGENHSIQG